MREATRRWRQRKKDEEQMYLRLWGGYYTRKALLDEEEKRESLLKNWERLFFLVHLQWAKKYVAEVVRPRLWIKMMKERHLLPPPRPTKTKTPGATKQIQKLPPPPKKTPFGPRLNCRSIARV